VGASRGRGGRERGLDALLDLLVRAGDLEVDGGRAAVLGQLALVARGERGGDVLDVRQALEPGDDVAHGGRERRVARADGPAALDQDLLADLVGKAGVRDGPVGHLGGAVPASSGSRVRIPTDPPRTVASRTKASQPKMAFLRWVALQRPIRAARLR
jgi:hypothetical protein